MARNRRPSAATLARDIRSGDVSPVEVVDETFDRIDRLNDELNAFVHLREEEAREEAADAERAVEEGDPVGPLHGVPIALKDLDSVIEGMPVTYGGSKALGEIMPEKTSIVVRRLRDAGAIVVGSTNSPEFGASADTTNPMFGSTGNPFDPEKTAGGSSGGSASAVGAGLVPIALGSDIAGSLRIPASACGTLGLKPTLGLVPDAAEPDLFGSTGPFLTKGVITRTVEDHALVLDIMGGEHPRDPLSVPDTDIDYLDAVGRPIDDLSIAFSPDFGIFEVEPTVVDRVEGVAETFREGGATVEGVDVDFGLSFEEALHAYNALVEPSIASSFESIKRGMGVDLIGDHRDELSAHLVEFVENGNEYSAVDYNQANVLRSQMYNVLQDVLDEYDLLLTPTVAVPPFEKGKREPDEINGQPLDTDKEWFLTWPLNLTGHPAASVPAGLSPDGLPIGAQVIGSRFEEEAILAASAAVERRQRWIDDYPAL